MRWRPKGPNTGRRNRKGRRNGKAHRRVSFFIAAGRKIYASNLKPSVLDIMADPKDWKSKIRHLFSHDIFDIEERELSPVPRFLVRQIQVARVVYRDFLDDGCLLRASALTYTTLLSIVPLLALMFSLLKGLGVQNTLEPLILHKIAAGSERIVSEIIGYINHTNVGSLGALGLVTLVLTVLALLSNIENSFNTIWGVQETRPLFRRFADYSSVLIFGPIFLFAAISMTTTLKSQAFVQKLITLALVGQVTLLLFKVLPYLAMWAAFTFLYIFMPNIKVHFRAALIGGILGGTLWQIAQWAYVNFQIGVARYNAIYGTMAALPIFMVWIYVSWLIVFLGLEVAYANQNLGNIRRELRGQDVNYASRELVALTVLMVVTDIFYRGEKPWGLEKIAEELDLPPRLTRKVVSELAQLGLLSVVSGPEEDLLYQPGRAPENLTVHEVIQALKESGFGIARSRKTPEWKTVRAVEEQLEEAESRVLEATTLKDLVFRMRAHREGGGETGRERAR